MYSFFGEIWQQCKQPWMNLNVASIADVIAVTITANNKYTMSYSNTNHFLSYDTYVHRMYVLNDSS